MKSFYNIIFVVRRNGLCYKCSVNHVIKEQFYKGIIGNVHGYFPILRGKRNATCKIFDKLFRSI